MDGEKLYAIVRKDKESSEYVDGEHIKFGKERYYMPSANLAKAGATLSEMKNFRDKCFKGFSIAEINRSNDNTNIEIIEILEEFDNQTKTTSNDVEQKIVK